MPDRRYPRLETKATIIFGRNYFVRQGGTLDQRPQGRAELLAERLRDASIENVTMKVSLAQKKMLP